MYVNLKIWQLRGSWGKKMFRVGCLIVLNSVMYFLNYFYYFEIFYIRVLNKIMSLIFFKEDIVFY